MATPTHIGQLVKYFQDNVEALKSPGYSEALVRQELVNPFFEELGWDVSNRALKPPEGREVIHEASLRIGGTLKAPDYSFRIDGKRKFFVEAKKPSVNIESARSAAYQIRRYCWNAGLPFGIVTDFEEFAVYDCRLQPSVEDSSAVGRIKYVTFDEYENEWEWLQSTFSRDSVLSGSLERLATAQPAPRGTRTIDVAFLDEIRGWRRLFAEDIAQRNTGLGVEELNSSVQALIDRIIFLRIAEARGLESDGELDRTRAYGQGIYNRLFQLFERADERYNSGLFHFRREQRRETAPDEIARRINVGDTALNTVIARLYYPEPYEFAVIPADILGQVYEQFLGEVITLSESGGAQVEVKPEVRKSGGIYYTPQPIVEYIVNETLRPLLSGRTVKQVEELRIVDPACGSGSFLIVAYQFLIDWHTAQYLSQPRNAKRFIEQGPDGQPRLKVNERRRILINNIYGVDIDSQAAEVAKLSLLLKLIEGQQQLELEVGRLLPDLDKNILCGNSIVASDFDTSTPPPGGWSGSLNQFDWSAGFPKIFENGGAFDVVIGNPPYFNVDSAWGRGDPRLTYLKNAYSEIYSDKTDVLFYFLKKAIDISRGEVAFIVSRSFLEATKARRLRDWLSNNIRVREILDFQHAHVFPGVGINTAIIRVSRSRRTGSARVRQLATRTLPVPYTAEMLAQDVGFQVLEVPQAKFGPESWLFAEDDSQAIVERLDVAGTPVGQILHVGKGMETGRNSVFQGLEPTIASDPSLADYTYVRARNSDIQKYWIEPSGPRVIYPERASHISDLPVPIQEHLTAHADELKARAAYIRGNCLWWKYTWPLHASYFDAPRIFVPYMAKNNRFALDASMRFMGVTDTTVLYENGQAEDLRYILGVLNSTVLEFRFRFLGKLKGGGVYEYFENTVSQLPVPRRKPGDADHDRIVQLVEKRIELTSELAGTLHGSDRGEIEAELVAVDSNINSEVAILFSLTDQDCAIIDSVLARQ